MTEGSWELLRRLERMWLTMQHAGHKLSHKHQKQVTKSTLEYKFFNFYK